MVIMIKENKNESEWRGKDLGGTSKSDREDTESFLLTVKNGTFTMGGYENNVDTPNADSDPNVSDHSETEKASFNLSGINFSVKRGETQACVGHVASGKVRSCRT